MKIAIPVTDGRLAPHFGRCEEFLVLEAGPEAGIGEARSLPAPPHQPGLLPRWLKERGVDVVIAGGMGRRAQALFAESGVQIVVGAGSDEPRTLVEQYLSGALVAEENPCDH